MQLGGLALQAAGLADDQHDLGPDAVIDPWLKEFWEKALVIKRSLPVLSLCFNSFFILGADAFTRRYIRSPQQRETAAEVQNEVFG